jgi:hypothetical protein
VNPDELADIRRRVEFDPAVERASDILTMHTGPHELLMNVGECFAQVPLRADARGDPAH